MTLRKVLAFNATYGIPEEIPSTDIVVQGQFKATGVAGVAFDANGFTIANVADPVNPTDGANKRYVDAIAQGLSVVDSCQALASSNIASLSGTMTIDGVALTAGARVLLVGQTNQVQNGVWLVQTGAWVRPPAPDYSTGAHAAGKFTFIESGTNYASEGWYCKAQPNADIIDTNPTTWTQFSGLGEVTAGNGLITSGQNGNAIAVNLASNSGLQFTGGALDHLLPATGGLQKTSSGLSILLDPNATLATTASGIKVLGVPSLFTINGVAVDANWTAANANILVDGPSSLADSLHQHSSVLSAQAVSAIHKNGSTALSIGDPVLWSGTADTLARGDAVTYASSQVIGVAAAAGGASGMVNIIKRGVAVGVLSQATPGQAIYLAVGGGLSNTVTTTPSANIVRMGYAKNSTDLDVNPVYIGTRAAN